MTPRRAHVALVTIALVGSLMASAPAGAASRCSGSTAGSFNIWCQSTSTVPQHVSASSGSGILVDRRPLFGAIGVPIACTTSGSPGIWWIHRVLRGATLVRVVLVCHVLNPVPGRLSADAAAQQVAASTRWPGLAVGAVPDAHFLVATVHGLYTTAPAQVAVGPIALSDGTTASGIADLVGVSWSIDGQRVDVGSSTGSRSAPVLGYVWSEAGRRTVDVVVTYYAVLTVSVPGGPDETVELGPVDIVARRDLPVEQMQALIDYDL